ncbi:MAG TPA: tryptophan synthase subunit alpha, partial [Streptosporangiaceae bacterium]
MSAAHIAGEAGRAAGVSPPSQGFGAPGAGGSGGSPPGEQSGGSPPRASRVSVAFEKAAAGGRAALVGYLPAGFPSVSGAAEAAVAIAQAGADVIEIGLPYSDPLMDGPVIQEATQRALAAGTH